jgi:hypothetical protein
VVLRDPRYREVSTTVTIEEVRLVSADDARTHEEKVTLTADQTTTIAGTARRASRKRTRHSGHGIRGASIGPAKAGHYVPGPAKAGHYVPVRLKADTTYRSA